MIDLTFSLSDLEFYLLVFTRITAFLYAAPYFSMNAVPKRYKIILGLFVSYIVYLTVERTYVDYDNVWQLATIIGKEVLVGLLLGMAVDIANSIILFAGRMMDMEIGFAMASEMDPATKVNATVSGLMYEYLIMTLLVISGLHEYLIRAIAETYELIPVNAVVWDIGKLMDSFLDFMASYMTVGFRIVLPTFCTLMMMNCVLGIMAKTAPQMHMFSIGHQLKVLAGLGVMFMTIGMMPYISDFIFSEMKSIMVTFVEAMMA